MHASIASSSSGFFAPDLNSLPYHAVLAQLGERQTEDLKVWFNPGRRHSNESCLYDFHTLSQGCKLSTIHHMVKTPVAVIFLFFLHLRVVMVSNELILRTGYKKHV